MFPKNWAVSGAVCGAADWSKYCEFVKAFPANNGNGYDYDVETQKIIYIVNTVTQFDRPLQGNTFEDGMLNFIFDSSLLRPS